MNNSRTQEILKTEKQERTGILDFYDCPLSEWPEDIFEMDWLTVLNVNPSQKWNGKRFSVKSSSKRGELKVIHSSIQKLIRLKHLSVSNNEVSKIEHLDKLVNLNSLYLSRNNISKIENIDDLINLTSLLLYSNQISKIENLDTLVNLNRLDLFNNRISKIENLDSLNLDSIDIAENPLVGLSEEEKKLVGTDFQFAKKISKDQKSRDIGEVSLPVKIIMVGNSEDGKTTLSKRLIGKEKVEKEESTYGLEIRTWKERQNNKEELLALIYDFGGQDYYHATYQMFFAHHAQYVLLWEADRVESKYISTSRSGTDFSNEEKYYAHPPEYWLGNIWYYIKRETLDNEIARDAALEEETNDTVLISTVQNMFPGCPEYPVLLNGIAEEVDDNINYQYALNLHNTKEPSADYHTYHTIVQQLKTNLKKLAAPRKMKLSKKDANAVNRIIDEVAIGKLTYDSLSIEEYKNKYNVDDTAYLKVMHEMGLVLYFHKYEELKNVIWIDPSTVAKKIYSILASLKEKAKYGLPEEIIDNEFEHNLPLKELLIRQEVLFLDSYRENGIIKKKYIIPQYLPYVNDNPLVDLVKIDIKSGFQLLFKDYVPHGLMGRLICRFGKNPDKKSYTRYEIVFSLGIDESESIEDENLSKIKVILSLDPILLKLTMAVSVFDDLPTSRYEIYAYLYHTVLAAYWDRPHLSFQDWQDFNVSLDLEQNVEILEERMRVALSNDVLLENTDYSIKHLVWAKNKIEKYAPYDMLVSVNGTQYVNYKDLKETESHQLVVPSYIIDESRNLTNIKLINRAQFNPFVSQPIKNIKKVFISYSHDDMPFVNKLMSFLVNLERDHKLEIWQDKMIAPGMDWDKTIKDNLETSDIVILLLSQEYIASKYVYENEFRMALSQAKNKRSRIVPVLLKECHWEGWRVYDKDDDFSNINTQKGYIGQYQFLPYAIEDKRLKPINKWQYPEDAWKQIVLALEDLCDDVNVDVTEKFGDDSYEDLPNIN